jgi:hypothetical protein
MQMDLNKINDTELIKKYKQYVTLSKIAQAGTIALGLTAIVVSFFNSNFRLVVDGGMLIILSFVWKSVRSEWEDKVIQWEKI